MQSYILTCYRLTQREPLMALGSNQEEPTFCVRSTSSRVQKKKENNNKNPPHPTLEKREERERERERERETETERQTGRQTET